MNGFLPSVDYKTERALTRQLTHCRQITIGALDRRFVFACDGLPNVCFRATPIRRAPAVRIPASSQGPNWVESGRSCDCNEPTDGRGKLTGSPQSLPRHAN